MSELRAAVRKEVGDKLDDAIEAVANAHGSRVEGLEDEIYSLESDIEAAETSAADERYDIANISINGDQITFKSIAVATIHDDAIPSIVGDFRDCLS